MKDFRMKGIEAKDGIVTLFGERIVFVPPNVISLLGQIYGQGSKPLLKYLGKKMGRRLIETWEEHLRPKTIEQLTDIFTEMVSTSGWGKLSLETIKRNERNEEEGFIFKLENNIAKLDNSRDICYFVSGLLSGFGEFALYSAQVTEIQCSIIEPDKNVCIFEVTKRNIDF